MPSTVNGIGTTYYAKKNLNKRQGTCEFCGREVELASYETRLWFVVLFVPLVPLGKKQILNDCPLCTRHRAVPLGEWQEISRDSLQETMDEAKQRPDDPEAALNMFGALVTFQRHEEAEEYARILAEKFSDHADVQVGLAVWHSEAGRDDQADACFRRALELDPDNRGIAQAVAVGAIERGDPAYARELLAFMETPGPEQEPGLLVMVADAFQAQGDGQSAMELYRIALSAAPEFARDKKLRKRIRAAEEALNIPDSETLAPDPPRNYGRRLKWIAAAICLIVAAWTANYYARTHQDLYLVSGLPKEVTVAIDEGKGILVGMNPRNVNISEGKHVASVTRANGQEETVEFVVENSLFQRFFGDCVFVLNVAKTADLIWEETEYSLVPDMDRTNPHKLHYAESFFTFRDIDYAFEEFPDQLELPANSIATRTRVGMLRFPPAFAMAMLFGNHETNEKLAYAEHHLTVDPTDEMLLRAYVERALLSGQTTRYGNFLEQGIEKRPILVDWHRFYQETIKTAAKHEAMVAKYDLFLSRDPNNSKLLYLRGRLEARTSDAADYFDRSIAADPESPYPYFAKCYHLAAQGDFEQARHSASKACELNPDDDPMSSVLFEIRFALEEYDALEAEFRKALKEAPLDLTAQKNLLRVLVADGRVQEARDAHAAFDAAAKPEGEEFLAYLSVHSLSSLRTLQYLTGDLEGWLASADELSDPAMKDMSKAMAQLELGSLEEAEEALLTTSVFPKSYAVLVLSLGWRQKGDTKTADRLWKTAVDEFAAGTADDRLVAEFLRNADEPGGAEEIDEVSASVLFKAILLVALAERSKTHREELLDKAEKLNLVGQFPYHFLKRTIQSLRS